MKRPRIIALVVLVLAGGVFVPFAEDVWVWVAYEHKPLRYLEPPYGGTKATQEEMAKRVVFKKYDWTPGPEFHVRGGPSCPQCTLGNHDACQPILRSIYSRCDGNVGPWEFNCACHPTHNAEK